jgi:hypothetical protein
VVNGRYMPARNSDGTIRNARSPKKLTERSVRARWEEAETVRLKRFGLGFHPISEQITAVGRGQAQPMVAIPADLTFPKNYHFGTTAAFRAYHRAVNREPSLEVEAMRVLDNARSEELHVYLQPKARKGDVPSVLGIVRVMDHQAKINGYAAPEEVRVTGKDGEPLIPIAALRRLEDEKDE